ncbi:MAG: ATP-binding cassette domain-containing protein, partial [Elusimicrobiota bacterium]
MILLQQIIKIYDKNVISFPDFSIDEGEFCLIKGRSGIGKTTLLEILSFLNKKSGGRYYFNNQNTDLL